MTAIVPVTSVTPNADFSDIRFSRSATGHVHSAWWSYDWNKYNPDGPYQIGSHFHGLRESSISAFAYALGIQDRNVMVSVRTNPIDGALEWRCGTSFPIELPKPRLTQAERMRKIEKLVGEVERNDGAIDI